MKEITVQIEYYSNAQSKKEAIRSRWVRNDDVWIISLTYLHQKSTLNLAELRLSQERQDASLWGE